MLKKLKLSQNTIIAINTISFGGAAIFGGIGIFSAISNFTKGDWYIYNSGIESLISGAGTSFFLAILALLFGVLAKLTIKKINNADLLKKSYEKLAIVSALLTVLSIAVAVSIMLFALIAIGAKGINQKTLWLNGFLSALIAAVVTGTTAYFSKKISSGKIATLPSATDIVLGIASVSFLLMIISTIVTLYAGHSSTPSNYLDEVQNGLEDFYNLFR